MASRRLWILIAAASSCPRGHGFRWRRRTAFFRDFRGGSSGDYDFRYSDDDGDGNLGPTENAADGAPPLPPYNTGDGPMIPPPPLPDVPYNDGVDYPGDCQASQEHFSGNPNYQPYSPYGPDGDVQHSMEVPPQYEQQQHHESQNILPPPPPPPEYSAKEQQESWDTTTTTDTMIEDLSSFDKDYILKGLARLYRKKILPLELSSRYGHFHSPPLSPSDFDAPPMILLLGQYSVGKTSFVKYLLGRDFPGIRVGPEPTTDRYVVAVVRWLQRIFAIKSTSDPMHSQFHSSLMGSQ